MIPHKDKVKINDFKEAYKKIMNPNNDKDTNEIIDALFYNVECNYEEYQSSVPYVSAAKEQYQYHILKPVNGRYSLLDFLLNRAISNVDCIRPCKENAYDHRKALLINTHRYEQYRSKYSEGFIRQQYHKSKLHETGHALHVWDRKQNNSIHTLDDARFLYPNSSFANFYDKLSGFEHILGNKYSNMLHLSEISNVPHTSHNSVSRSCPFDNHDIDEAATEYFATKYSGLYKEKQNFGVAYVSTEPIIMAITAPNHFNGYAHSSKFIYHLENLVSKPAMFESTFFESDLALREFSMNYAPQIEKLWKTHAGSKELPTCTDTFSKFQYLFRTACDHKAKGSPDETRQVATRTAHQILDWIFYLAYNQEFNNGNIPKDKMLEILKLSYRFSPRVYDSNEKKFNETKIATKYFDCHENIKNSLNTDSPSPTGR